MENSWQKVKNHNETLYVNLFKSNDFQFSHEVRKWNEYLLKLKNTHSEMSYKNNDESVELIQKGKQFFQQKQFYHAMELFTKALCFAEIDTEHVSLAFAKRAACFFHMKMYNRALTDVELALNTNCISSELTQKLDKLEDDCRQMLKINPIHQLSETKSNFMADSKFSCIVNTLTISSNHQFGRHLIAKCDINVGEMVLLEERFASVAKNNIQITCYTCLTEIENFIAC